LQANGISYGDDGDGPSRHLNQAAAADKTQAEKLKVSRY